MKKTNNSMDRYERKWVFDNIDYNQLSILLYRSKLFFSTQFQDREVNSIYFDDQNYSAIKQNVEGVSSKKKYRLRWYGNLNKITNSVFEVKKKNGFVVKKENFFLKKLNNLNLLNYDHLNKIEKFINDNFKFKNKLSPVLTTHYLRSYFISSNELVRATIDINLKSLPLYRNSNISIIKEFKEIILEIKYDTNLDIYVRNNLKQISSRLSKNSKFVNSATINAFSYM